MIDGVANNVLISEFPQPNDVMYQPRVASVLTRHQILGCFQFHTPTVR